jgi:hypothetical protein
MAIVNLEDMIMKLVGNRQSSVATSWSFPDVNPYTDNRAIPVDSFSLNDDTGRNWFIWEISYWEQDTFNLNSDVVNE